MRIRRIAIFVVEILLLILTIIQLATIINLRSTYKTVAEYKLEEVTEVRYVVVPMVLENAEQNIIEEEQDNEVKEDIFLGNFMLTAYCSCYECCGEYALNRPVDSNGNEIVYGSIGEVLTEGYSIAVDPNVIPYGTEVVIDGVMYKAQDCGGAIKGNEIDVYFADHKKAQEFAVQYKDVYLKG